MPQPSGLLASIPLTTHRNNQTCANEQQLHKLHSIHEFPRLNLFKFKFPHCFTKSMLCFTPVWETLQSNLKYTLLAQASVEFLPPPRATAFFLPTPAFPPETYVTLRPSSSWSRYPVLALSGTSKPLESNRIIQTKTLQAPLASFAAPKVRSAPSRTEPPVIFREDDGLLCLERVIPNEISRRLERLAKAFNPFKVEAYRGGLLDTTEHWLDTLIEPFLAGSISSSCFRDPSQHQRVTSSDRVPQAEKNVLSVALNSEELAEPIEDAVIWLRDDISNVAKLFAQEVAGWSASWPRFDMTVKGKEGGEVGLTVKLELLRKGKCPRYHLDKVGSRRKGSLGE